MCVKEFLGFTCGHCSIPYLRQCPLTASQPTFPPCKIPGERPIFTNENCPPCSRVVWNIQVLEQEHVHRQQHRRGECGCETIFDEEERQHRSRPRPRPVKGKAKDGIHTYNDNGAEKSTHVKIIQGNESDTVADIPHQSPTGCHPGQEKPQIHDVFNHQPLQSDQGPSTEFIERQYVGYYIAGSNAGFTHPLSAVDHVAQGGGFPLGGFVPHNYTWAGQPQMGQAGAGMIWYPGSEVLSRLPEMPTLAMHNAAYHDLNVQQRVWERIASESTERAAATYESPTATIIEPLEYTCMKVSQLESEQPFEHDALPQQPAIVSSSMALTMTD